MEEGLLEQMYGDLGNSDSPMVHDEDSVDIYSGLDSSPRSSEHTVSEKPSTLVSPQRLKDSMDLYEEIIKEEQQEKQATCSELKTKLDAAQNQVKELLHKLQQIQIQNTSLHTENTCLKKNICSLIKTARLEIVRKDEEINRLLQRRGYGRSFPQSEVHFQRNQFALKNCAASQEPAIRPQTQGPRVTYASEQLPKPHSEDRNGGSLYPGPLHTNTSALTSPSHLNSRPVRTDSEVPKRLCDSAATGSNRDSRNLQTQNNQASIQQTTKPHPGNKVMQQKVCEKQAVASQDIKGRKFHGSERRGSQECNASDASKDSKVNARASSDKESRDSVSTSRSRHQLSNRELCRRSEREKSPPHQKNKSHSSGSLHRTACSSHSSKNRSRDMEPLAKGSSRESRYRHDRDWSDRNAPESINKEGKRSSSDQGSLPSKSCVSSSHKGERSPIREQHRKEERGREEQSRSRGERKSSRTEKSKQYERSKGYETDKRERDSSRKKSEEKKDKESEGCDSSKNGRQISLPSTLTAAADSSDPMKSGVDKHLASVQPEVIVKNHVESEIVGECEVGEKKSEESNQNRKLSFMETLNLTLSPVKKPRLSSGSKENEISLPEGVQEGQVEEESSEFNFGEEYCVLDELDSSHETVQGNDDVFETATAERFGVCGAEMAQETLPDFKTTECKHGQNKRENAVHVAHISDRKTKHVPERPVDENAVLENSNCKSPTTLADQDTKLATPQKPINHKDHSSGSKMDDAGIVKTALPAKSLNCEAENQTEDSVVQKVLVTDNDTHVCRSNSENLSSLVCETSSVECIETVAHAPAVDSVDSHSTDSHISVQTEWQKTTLTVQPEVILQDAASSPTVDTHSKDDTTSEGACDISTDAVSSTVSGDVVSQSNADNADFVSDVMETVVISSTEPEKDGEKPVTDQSLSKTQVTDMPKVSTTFTGQSGQPEQGSGQISKECCSSEPDSTEDEERHAKPSSSVPLAYDEDSMMLTLKSIQQIPEAISPLTSPVRPVKKSLPHCPGKGHHVKSLSKDLSTVTGARRMDVNKENEKPHCSSTQITQSNSDQKPPSSSSSSENDNELEEGEIISDCEDDEPPATPSPQLRKTQPAATIKKPPSPRSPRPARKQTQRTPVVSHDHSGIRSKATATPDNSPTSNKRLKTVLPLFPKSNPSTVPEVMDMLKSIRYQLRKKYMKLNKSFPKKSFYNIIEMSLFSFTDFVNNISLSKFCSQESILKPKLNNIISITMNKISNNGIVNRIFEQHSPSLKQKLWSFVEGQFDFLFKEIQATLTNLCKPPEARHLSKAQNKVAGTQEKIDLHKIPDKSPVCLGPTPKRKAGEVDSTDMSGVHRKKIMPPSVIPHRTGLGSRGKNLRMNKTEESQSSVMEDDRSCETQALVPLPFPSPSKTTVSPSKNVSSAEKPAACVRRLSHNSSLQDKSDFEILTEQQTSSLTFNLVTDSQMGEIFKCLLQGSDLLENSVSGGDAHSWPVGTPRKDSAGGESFVVVTTPNKTTATPSKILSTWSNISPCKFSPNPKLRVPLNPAILDESCLLEVPSSLPLCKTAASSTVPSQKSYSILAEDLAVSLTIPSPLKSDGHLSFLNPDSGEPVSAPDSVISAHFSEDALMDGEDATEQDIHLALDSDNSSASSSGCQTWEQVVAPPTFQFKPHLPMQAVVMEKSNDHFIVRIRHTSTSLATSTSQNSTNDDKELQKAVREGPEQDCDARLSSDTSTDGDSSGQYQNSASCDNYAKVSSESSLSGCCPIEQAVNSHDVNGEHSHGKPENRQTQSETMEIAPVSDEPVITAGESSISEKGHNIRNKRKKRHSEPRAKRVKREHIQGSVSGLRKKKLKGVKVIKSAKSKKSKSMVPPLSPRSLSAKNVIRRKGEVVVTWTRDEDRDILVGLKLKGPSAETFSALSAKINKPPALIAERFCQLMKLFKKKEKMES
ncbi:hypothetical protein AGOR_G00083110 [Albula goreensis]|uniref:CASP8-associated protein 2 n=1 Tax=Albula goreensis TaxID=1534307 RepID=A0A8T3DMP9_9TELE|nr:hypothetical protein AGOR_G00083110 [Albula goreensis]